MIVSKAICIPMLQTIFICKWDFLFRLFGAKLFCVENLVFAIVGGGNESKHKTFIDNRFQREVILIVTSKQCLWETHTHSICVYPFAIFETSNINSSNHICLQKYLDRFKSKERPECCVGYSQIESTNFKLLPFHFWLNSTDKRKTFKQNYKRLSYHWGKFIPSQKYSQALWIIIINDERHSVWEREKKQSVAWQN